MDASAIVAAATGGDLLEELIDSLEVGLLLQGRDGHALLSNPSARRILGLSADQLAGSEPIDPRWTILNEDGRPLPRDERTGRMALRSGRSCHEKLLAVRHPNGRVTWVSASAQP